MDKVMEKACEMFHDALHELTERGRFDSAKDVETAKAAVSGIVKIKTLEAMEEFTGGGSSFRRGRSYDGENGRSYDEGSYRRGRGMDGRYVSRDGMRDKLEALMQEATGQDKRIMQEMIDRMG